MKDRNKYSQDESILFSQYSKQYPNTTAKHIAEQIKKAGESEISLDLLTRRVSAWMKDSNKTSYKILESHNTHNRLKSLQSEKSALITEINELESRLNTLIDLDVEYKPKPIIATNKAHSQATALMNASDWHAEETVRPDTVNYINEYNINIFEKRANNFWANGLRLLEIARQSITINSLVVGLLGDMITGYIHEELVEGNSLSPTEALLRVFNNICNGLQYLLDKSKCNDITVMCKYGNHGRTTQKSRISTAYKNSFEWLMYHMIASKFKGEERLKFVIENSYHSMLDIYGYKIRFHHGDWTKYQGGVGGLTIPIVKAISQWDKLNQAYLDVFGHYHTRMLDTGSNKFVSNGSLIGFTPYSIHIKAAFEEPSQSFFLIDEKRGKTITAPIFVK